MYAHNGPENLKKSRQKNLWNQINQNIFFVKLHFWQFSQFKNWFLAIFEIAKKMEFAQKKFREIDWFDFTSFFAWTFLKFSGLLCIFQLSLWKFIYLTFIKTPYCSYLHMYYLYFSTDYHLWLLSWKAIWSSCYTYSNSSKIPRFFFLNCQFWIAKSSCLYSIIWSRTR